MLHTDVDGTDVGDVLRRLDRNLIRFVHKFGLFNKGDPRSFQLPEEITILPQLLYNLRRSTFVETFNCSPDESAFYRACSLRENVANVLTMIQPALLEYSFDSPDPIPVLLDSQFTFHWISEECRERS